MRSLSSSANLYVDTRALQDPDFRNRGIGRLATNLIRGVGAARLVFSSIVALVDEKLPALDPEVAALFDQVTARVKAPLTSSCALLQLSPMTHSALPIAKLLDSPSIFKTSIVYDFIPLEFPDRYLSTESHRLNYRTCVAWLAKYHTYFPISDHVKLELQRLIPVSSSRIAISNGPVSEKFFERHNAVSSSEYILACGGEPRKNVPLAIKAHSTSTFLQKRNYGLVLLSESPGRLAEYRALAKEYGGNPALLSITSNVNETQLANLFQSAALVVVPSKSEGFSLPVIEAMASGVPVIASNIPAHRELIDDTSDLFSSHNFSELSDLINLKLQLREAPAEHAKVARRKEFAKQYTGERIRSKFWIDFLSCAVPYLSSIEAVPIIRSRPRIAFISPMPPTPSGIADYSAATIAALGEFADVTVYVDGLDPQARLNKDERPISSVPFISSTFDRVISAVGNSSAFHSHTMDILDRRNSAIIAHDSRMLGYYMGRFGSLHTANLASKELGRQISQRQVIEWTDNEELNEVSLFDSLIASGEPLMVHSPILRSVISERFGMLPVYLPFATNRRWEREQLSETGQAISKERLGYSRHDILVSSFGYVHRSKLPLQLIKAVYEARQANKSIKLAFVGRLLDPEITDAAAQYDPEATWIRLVQDYVNEDRYADYLLSTNVAVQLRTHGWGSVSAALMDCIATGIPCVATTDLANAICSPEFVARVGEPPTISELSQSILQQVGKRHSENVESSARIFAQEHSFRNYAVNLMNALSLQALEE